MGKPATIAARSNTITIEINVPNTYPKSTGEQTFFKQMQNGDKF